MSEIPKRIMSLMRNPQESLDTELKSWISPEDPSGKAKIVKAIIALYNNNGGDLLIGFDDKSGKPLIDEAPENIKGIFHIDNIQPLISKYTTNILEVKVYFPEIGGVFFPVISVPPGVTKPSAAKKEIKDNEQKLLKKDMIYVRTNESNHKPSTSEFNYHDLELLMEKCFENREADIGRFLRRHLVGISPETVTGFFESIQIAQNKLDPFKKVNDILISGYSRYQNVVKEREADLPEHGALEVAVKISGGFPAFHADINFLNLIGNNTPHYSGKPPWMVILNPADRKHAPYHFDNSWEAFIVSLGGFPWLIDFWRIDPRGKFYLRSAYREDAENNIGRKPLAVKYLEWTIEEVAEIMVSAISYAKGMGCDKDEEFLDFAFRWSGLNERLLGVHPQTRLYPRNRGKAYKDVYKANVTVPLDTPLSSLYVFVHEVVSGLHALFGGSVLEVSESETIVKEFLDKKEYE